MIKNRKIKDNIGDTYVPITSTSGKYCGGGDWFWNEFTKKCERATAPMTPSKLFADGEESYNGAGAGAWIEGVVGVGQIGAGIWQTAQQKKENALIREENAKERADKEAQREHEEKMAQYGGDTGISTGAVVGIALGSVAVLGTIMYFVTKNNFNN